MVKIVISKSSHEALAARATSGVFLAGQARPDGMFVIVVDEEVSARLEAIHPDPDQAIRILCSTGVGNS